MSACWEWVYANEGGDVREVNLWEQLKGNVEVVVAVVGGVGGYATRRVPTREQLDVEKVLKDGLHVGRRGRRGRRRRDRRRQRRVMMDLHVRGTGERLSMSMLLV